MIAHAVISEMEAHDAVMSWLQNFEMKDRKLGSARRGRARSVEVWSAIGRMQELAYLEFPHIDHRSIDSYVRKYIDPQDLASVRPGG